MGRLFLRIFLWFWLGSTCLLLVLALTLLILRPDNLTPWRTVARDAMIRLGTDVAEAYEQAASEQVARERGAAKLAELGRAVEVRVWLYTADGRPVGAPLPLTDPRELVTRALAGDEVERAIGMGRFLLAHRVITPSGRSYVFVWESPIRFPLRPPVFPFVTRVLALVLTGGVACWWLTWQITKPIRTLRGAARRFSAGDLAVRVSARPELQRGDDLSELAREFDQMASRIGELVTAQQQLLADISHELRSPLARLSLALDLAQRRVSEGRVADGVPEHQRIAREIQRMNELIEQLLTLARLQGQSHQSRTEPVNLRDLVHEVVQDARFEAEAAGRTVVITGECEATSRGSRSLLRSAIENVLRNAVRHAPEHTIVTIAMTREPELARDDVARRVTIVVRDQGPGVPEGALHRLFDPFYRVDEARDRASGGLGLGLTITRQAMLLHGGTASAQNHPDGGLEVRLDLPID